ncbi:HCP-like protein [Atractiella rhizophila]|nr:HCP-like protein [Atractiella rhizophila]
MREGEEQKVMWSREVLKFIERFQSSAASSSPNSPEAGRITDPQLVRWTDEALKFILGSSLPLATYLQGELSSTGSFPSYRQKDLKVAFREFEAAANKGWPRAWFRIGREYETFGDSGRAVMAFENGRKKGDCGCIYRLGMAYLLGQLGRNPDPSRAVRLLKQAADLSDLDFPQPAYIYGMLLAGEFEHVTIPPTVLSQDINLARTYIQKSAYYRYPAAEYKMGFSAEYALLGVPFDPLLSVQYYSLASQQGEVEADMALSKWFLCGAEGSFAVNEDLAFTFAEKSARKGLPSAEFAIGYYFEVGIGCTKDVQAARKWYELVRPLHP